MLLLSLARIYRTSFLIFTVALCVGFFSVGETQAFSSKPADSSATGGSSSSETVWISRKDGGTSCSVNKAQTLEEGANELKMANVQVIESHKSSDGKMYAQMCGMPTGIMNAYLINRSDLPKAVGLGYHEAASQK